MDHHYDSQINLKPSNASLFRGPARQYGSGGLGAFAMRMGRVAVPLVKKYVLPVAKEFGRNLLTTFIPEVSNIVSGKKRPRKALKDSLKMSVEKTAATRSTVAPPVKRAAVEGEPQRTERNRAAGRPIGDGGRTKTKLKRNKVISKKNVAKRSRSDILSSVSFSDI